MDMLSVYSVFSPAFFYFKIHHGHLYWVKKKEVVGDGEQGSGEGEKRKVKRKKALNYSSLL